MSRKLDPNSSSQRWEDGSRAYCEYPDSQENLLADEDDWKKNCTPSPLTESEQKCSQNDEKCTIDSTIDTQMDTSASDSMMNEDTEEDEIDEVEGPTRSQTTVLLRENSIAVSMAKELLGSDEKNEIVQGTHIHVRNKKIHFCALSPFEIIDDKQHECRDQQIEFYLETMELLPFHVLFNLFQRAEMNLTTPIEKNRFPSSIARKIFNTPAYQTFRYSCLTVEDCEKLRQHYIQHLKISPCKCEKKNCLDFSKFNSLYDTFK